MNRNQVARLAAQYEVFARYEMARRHYIDYVNLVHHGKWIPARHLELVCNELEGVLRGETKRLMIFMPPRHGKSMSVTKTFPSYFLGRFPNRRVIEVSYGEDLAREFGEANRQKINEFGMDLFGIKLSDTQGTKVNWNIDGHDGGMISVGVGGAITGKGADLLIIDDPIKNRQEAESEAYRRQLEYEYVVSSTPLRAKELVNKSYPGQTSMMPWRHMLRSSHSATNANNKLVARATRLPRTAPTAHSGALLQRRDDDMLNMLVDELPDAIEVSGRPLPIRTDFRIGIIMDSLIRDKSLSSKDKVRAMLNLYLKEKPGDTNQAIDGILDFFSCGKKEKGSGPPQKPEDSSAKRNIFSYEYDAGYIAAAFLAHYGIDLLECDMHWYRFVALFTALPSECEIKKIMGYRAANLSEIKGKHEKNRIARLQALHALPEEYSGISGEELAGQISGGGLF